MIKILFAGEGGQGVQVAAEILAKAAFLDGKKSLYIPNFGVEQRGGVSLAFVTIADQAVVYPKFDKADILVIFSDRSIERVKSYFGPKTQVILTPAVSQKINFKVGSLIKIEPRDFPAKIWNILALGEVNKIGKIVAKAVLKETLIKRFTKQFEKDQKLKELDLKALEN